MFLVVSRFNGNGHFSKWDQNPRSYGSWKTWEGVVVGVYELTPKGDDVPLDTLRVMWADGVFDKPSDFHVVEAPPPPPKPKPPKELTGETT